MSMTLKVILFVSLEWLCHKMLLFYLCVLKYKYYFKNSPTVTVTTQIISTPNFIALFCFTLK